MSSVSGSPTSSATIGRTRSFFSARAVTCVGSQPVLAIPTSTRHVSSPSDVDRGVLDLEARRRRAPGTRRTRRAARPRRAAGAAAGWSTCRGRSSRRARRAELRVVERVPVDVADGVVVLGARRASAAPPGPRPWSGRCTRSGSTAWCRSRRGRCPRTRWSRRTRRGARRPSRRRRRSSSPWCPT